MSKNIVSEIVFIGKVFGRWKVLERAENYRSRVLAECECGLVKKVSASDLIRGPSKGCGPCSKRTHGASHSRAFRIWAGLSMVVGV